MRELRVEDALMYLDQVKMEFGDRPHIYNEFLDIMKTFKSQTIDTPGVIRRVASLFHGNKRLVLGFNTFLPEGYRIELPLDGSAWPVYREPGRSGVIAIAPPSSSSALADGEMPGQAGGHPPGGCSGGPRGPTTTGPPVPLSSRVMRPGPTVGHGTSSGMPPANIGRGGGVGVGHPPSSGMQLHQQQQHSHHLQQQQQQPQQPSHLMARGVGPSAIPQLGAPAPTQRTGSVGVPPYPGGAPAPGAGMLKGPHPHPSQQGGVMGAAGGGGARPVAGMGPPSHHPPLPSSTGRGPSIHPGPPSISAPGATQPSHSYPSSGGGGAGLSSSSSTTVLGGGAGAGTAQPIEFDHAINYVTTIKRRFASHPEIYRKFLEILHTYQKEQRGIKEVLDEVSVLFADHADLLKEFTYFLPDAVQSQAKAQLDVAAKKAEDRARAREQQQQQSVAAAAALAGAAAASSASYTTGHDVLSSRNDASTTTATGTTMLQHQQPTSMGGGGLDHSTMAQHKHQPHHPPNLPPPPPSSSSTGGRYGAGLTVHTSLRSEPTVPSHIAKIPFGATKGRSEDREREISRGAVHGIVSFGPSRPPRRHELNPAQAAQLLGRPTTIPLLPLQPMTSESAFLERVKSHFLRCDLFPDKPIVNRKQTPYMEFLKCLHLFGVGIINKDELIQLLRGLFIQGNIPKNATNNSTNAAATQAAMGLLTELERVLVGRGPFATQERTKKLKGRYGGYPIREYEFANPSTSSVVTPSYRAFPADYAFDKLSAEMEKDGELLNYKCYCVAPGRSSNDGRGGKYLMSPEYYDGIKLRCNIHEEVLARVEEEIHEVDMAIERNASAMRVLEPVAEEAKRLREQEEDDGQPIGRLQYKLRNRALNSIHIGAIARIYGDSGEEVLQHLLRNPLVVVPIVYNRLKEKNDEWRKVKKEMRKEWKSVMSENFAGSLDAKSVYKREIEQCHAAERLIEDCVRAKTFAKHPNKIHRHPATNMILPDFHLMNPDPALALFQPHLSVLVSKSMPHEHAFDLLRTCVSRDSNKHNNNDVSLQKSLEFISSWFGLSQNIPRSENCYTSSEKYAPGMRVRTAVGDGKIISVAHFPVLRYLMKFEYGTGYVMPDLIFELAPTSELDTNAMNDDDDDDNALHLMPDDIQVLFGTEKIYLFMRLYIILVTMLYQAKDVVDRKSEVSDKQDLFARLVSSLKDTLIGRMDGKAFEQECKKNLYDDAYNFVAIPPLVVKCAAASIRMSTESHFHDLYYYSQLKLKASISLLQDLKQQRNLSLELTDDAVYRLQIQSSASQVFFSYVPADAELQLTNPMDGSCFTPSSLENERPLATNVEPEQKRMKTEAENISNTTPP